MARQNKDILFNFCLYLNELSIYCLQYTNIITVNIPINTVINRKKRDCNPLVIKIIFMKEFIQNKKEINKIITEKI